MIRLNDLISTIHQAVLVASDTLAKKNLEVLDTYFENATEEDSSKLKPKTVTIQYPQVTAKGVEVHDVHVPIIALIPIAMAEISEVKLKTTLELSLEDDVLLVGFPSKKNPAQKKDNKDPTEEDKSCLPHSSLEITLCPSTPPDGLKKIVEGYEKALRAQIPG